MSEQQTKPWGSAWDGLTTDELKTRLHATLNQLRENSEKHTARLAAAERERDVALSPLPDRYACQRCGRRCGLDAVTANDTWERLSAAAGGVNLLCLWCMDALAAKLGITERVSLHFAGLALAGSSQSRADEEFIANLCNERDALKWHIHEGAEALVRMERERDAAEAALARAEGWIAERDETIDALGKTAGEQVRRKNAAERERDDYRKREEHYQRAERQALDNALHWKGRAEAAEGRAEQLASALRLHPQLENYAWLRGHLGAADPRWREARDKVIEIREQMQQALEAATPATPHGEPQRNRRMSVTYTCGCEHGGDGIPATCIVHGHPIAAPHGGGAREGEG